MQFRFLVDCQNNGFLSSLGHERPMLSVCETKSKVSVCSNL